MRWQSYGPEAVLVEIGREASDRTRNAILSILKDLEERPVPGIRDYSAGFTSILLQFDRRLVSDPAELQRELQQRFRKSAKRSPQEGPLRQIPVIYDGEDLERVASLHKLPVREVIKIHSKTIYQVNCLGFAPGFPYLGPLDKRLHTPRLSSPRLQVPAGSVAIGGKHTGIYTVNSPGGWNLIGRTDVKIFDALRGPPAGPEAAMFFLQAGDRVQFIPVS